MRITTLGASHGDATYCRFNSSTLVEVGASAYLIDAGAPVNALMVRAGKDIRKLKAVFITHMHEDHVGGLPGVIKSLLKRPEPGQHTDIFLPEESAIAGLSAWLRAMRLKWPSTSATLAAFQKGRVYSDGMVAVTATPNHHMVSSEKPVSFSFLMEAEGKRVVFTGDLSGDFSDFPDIARREPCDLCICEMTHFPPEAALPVLKECPMGRLVFNHIHNPWHGEGENRLFDIFASLPYPFDIAHDGDVFEI
jgi:ribonuclease BN (tRNA processing enzyme)